MPHSNLAVYARLEWGFWGSLCSVVIFLRWGFSIAYPDNLPNIRPALHRLDHVIRHIRPRNGEPETRLMSLPHAILPRIRAIGQTRRTCDRPLQPALHISARFRTPPPRLSIRPRSVLDVHQPRHLPHAGPRARLVSAAIRNLARRHSDQDIDDHKKVTAVAGCPILTSRFVRGQGGEFRSPAILPVPCGYLSRVPDAFRPAVLP